MKKTIKITQSTIQNIVEKVLNENNEDHGGNGVTIQMFEDKLEIMLDSGSSAKEEIQDMVDDRGFGYAEHEILGDYTGFRGNGATIVNGDQIGQMTDALFVLYDGVAYTDMNYYQIRSYVEDLLDSGKAVLNRVTEWSEKDVYGIEDGIYGE